MFAGRLAGHATDSSFAIASTGAGGDSIFLQPLISFGDAALRALADTGDHRENNDRDKRQQYHVFNNTLAGTIECQLSHSVPPPLSRPYKSTITPTGNPFLHRYQAGFGGDE